METEGKDVYKRQPGKEDAMRIDREEKAARAETLFREGYNLSLIHI